MPISNLKLNGLLFDPLIPICVRQWCQLSKLLYNTAAEVLANLINADKRIKGIQIGDHEIEIVNFTDNSTIFLKDITCPKRIQVILRLSEKNN